MLDRLVNVLTVVVLALALAVLWNGLYLAWYSTPPWDKEWAKKPEAQPSHAVDQILTALRNATDMREYADAKRLEEILESSYAPTGNVLVHISKSEILDILWQVAIVLSLLALPVSINYVRRARFRLWNCGA